MNKKNKTLSIIFISVIIFLSVIFFLKAPVTDYFARRTLLKIVEGKWKSLSFGFQNRPCVLYNEEKQSFKKLILNSFTFDAPQKKLSKLYKAKIVCDDGSIAYLWFSSHAWSFSDSKGKIGKLYRVKNFPSQYNQKLYIITSFHKLLNKPPQLPTKMSKYAQNNLELFFKNTNSSTPINIRRLAAYFQMLHDYNTLNTSPYKDVKSANEGSEYLLKNKDKISYQDFLKHTGAVYVQGFGPPVPNKNKIIRSGSDTISIIHIHPKRGSATKNK